MSAGPQPHTRRRLQSCGRPHTPRLPAAHTTCSIQSQAVSRLTLPAFGLLLGGQLLEKRHGVGTQDETHPPEPNNAEPELLGVGHPFVPEARSLPEHGEGENLVPMDAPRGPGLGGGAGTARGLAHFAPPAGAPAASRRSRSARSAIRRARRRMSASVTARASRARISSGSERTAMGSASWFRVASDIENGPRKSQLPRAIFSESAGKTRAIHGLFCPAAVFFRVTDSPEILTRHGSVCLAKNVFASRRAEPTRSAVTTAPASRQTGTAKS